MQTNNIRVLLQQAIQQAKNGQKRAAAHNLALVLRADPNQVDAWLWLSACVDTREKQIYCLQQLLRIDPEHRAARKGLEMLANQPIPVTGAIAYTLPGQGAHLAADRLSTPESDFSGPFDSRKTTRAASHSQPTGQEPIYEVHAESPVEMIPARRRPIWLVALLILAAIGAIFFFWRAQGSPGGGESGRPFVWPAGVFAPANARLTPGSDLAEALRAAPEGGVVHLEPGVYTLTETLEIDRAVQLRGEGMNATRIHSSAPGAVLRIRAQGSIQLNELELLHTGALPAHGVVVENGQLFATGIRIGGARQDQPTGENGSGLLIRHQASAEVRVSEMLDNARAGIEIRSPGTVVIRNNAIHDNGQYGILVSGSANPRLQENDLTRNGDAGILLSESARGDARKNRLEQNGATGIRVEGVAVSLVYENTSQANVGYGIEVRGQAAPILIGNILQRNGRTGLAYFDRAAGAAESNDCSQNELHGISVNQNAAPFLKQNRCNQNRQVGIDYWGDSGGTAANNECSQNGLQGISVHENALPVLQNNTCNANSDSGIVYWDDAAGTASNNECSENRLNGISVHDSARPVLMKNTCRANLMNGIAFYDVSGGEALENECNQNGSDLILLPDGTGVRLQGNRCGATVQRE